MISVMTGAQLQFTNEDAVDHQVASNDCSELSSAHSRCGRELHATNGRRPQDVRVLDALMPGTDGVPGHRDLQQSSTGDAGYAIPMALRHLAASWSALDRERMFAAALLGGMALLLLRLRSNTAKSSGDLALLDSHHLPSGDPLGGLVALAPLDEKGRHVLAMLFAAGIAVGLLGFWFHTDGHLVTGLRNILLAWRVPLGRTAGSRWAASRRRWPRGILRPSLPWACSSMPRRREGIAASE